MTVILLAALALGWFAQEYRRAERRTIVLSELGGMNVHCSLNEPTGLGQIARKFLAKPREDRLRKRIGPGWFDRPTIFVCFNLADDQVDGAVERLNRLESVREIHYQGPRLTEAGIARLRDGLPGVNVVPSDRPELHHYFRSKMGTHALYEGPLILLGILASLLVGMVLAVRALLRWLRRAPRAIEASQIGAARDQKA